MTNSPLTSASDSTSYAQIFERWCGDLGIDAASTQALGDAGVASFDVVVLLAELELASGLELHGVLVSPTSTAYDLYIAVLSVMMAER